MCDKTFIKRSQLIVERKEGDRKRDFIRHYSAHFVGRIFEPVQIVKPSPLLFLSTGVAQVADDR